MTPSSATQIVIDVSGLPADAVTVDALAWLELVAQRLGRRVHVRNASEELRRLITFVGLDDVLRLEPGR